jgi:hypothetical protein
MFVFNGHSPMIENFSNTEYEYNPSGSSGASKAHIRPYITHIHRHRLHYKKNSLLFARGDTSKRVNPSKSLNQFTSLSYHFLIHINTTHMKGDLSEKVAGGENAYNWRKEI